MENKKNEGYELVLNSLINRIADLDIFLKKEIQVIKSHHATDKFSVPLNKQTETINKATFYYAESLAKVMSKNNNQKFAEIEDSLKDAVTELKKEIKKDKHAESKDSTMVLKIFGGLFLLLVVVLIYAVYTISAADTSVRDIEQKHALKQAAEEKEMTLLELEKKEKQGNSSNKKKQKGK